MLSVIFVILISTLTAWNISTFSKSKINSNMGEKMDVLAAAMERVREMTERLRRINKKNKEEEKGELYSNRRRTNRLRYFSVWQHEKMKTDEWIDLKFQRLNSTVFFWNKIEIDIKLFWSEQILRSFFSTTNQQTILAQ